MTKRDRIVVITGPTATGKTALGVALALAKNGEVISADSMQLYKGMDIGTAKPTKEEMRGVPHHMLDVADPGEAYSVSRYVEDAAKCVDDVLSRGKLPILVGGTGLYIESLLSGRDFAQGGGDDSVRLALSAEYDELGGEEMLKKLSFVDPEAAARLHPNDKKRVVRALEVWQLTGRSITRHDEETREKPPRYESVRFALTFRDRQDLYDRIDRRVDEMLRLGLEDEARRLLAGGLDGKSTAMQAIGYKEMLGYLRGESSLEEAADDIKRQSRRYAKRQLSWLRRDEALRWIIWEKEPDFAAALRDSTTFLDSIGI